MAIYDLAHSGIDVQQLLANDPDFSADDINKIDAEVHAGRKRSEDYTARYQRLEQGRKNKP